MPAEKELILPIAGKLLARTRVALRRAARQNADLQEPVFTLGNPRGELAQRVVFVDDREVHQAPLKYKLLLALIRHARTVITHTQLLKAVWGPVHVNEVYLHVYMAQPRHKLEADPTRPRSFMNEPGIGYRLKYDPEE